jgi:tetratricopeptide (TPR) repeat protein
VTLYEPAEVVAGLHAVLAAEPESRALWYALAIALDDLEPRPTDEILAALDRAEAARDVGPLTDHRELTKYLLSDPAVTVLDILGKRFGILRTAGRYAQAHDVALAWIAAAPSASLPRHVAGMALLDQRLLTEAIARFGEAIEREPDPAIAAASHYQRGRAYTFAGARAEALVDIARAVEQNPERWHCTDDDDLAPLHGEPGWAELAERSRVLRAGVERKRRVEAVRGLEARAASGVHEDLSPEVCARMLAIAHRWIDAPQEASALAEQLTQTYGLLLPTDDDDGLSQLDREHFAHDVACTLGMTFVPARGFVPR